MMLWVDWTVFLILLDVIHSSGGWAGAVGQIALFSSVRPLGVANLGLTA